MKLVLTVILVLLAQGCATPAATLDHIDTQVAAHDGAFRLTETVLDNKQTMPGGGDNISAEDIEATPRSVLALLKNLVFFQHKSRVSWHTLKFTMGNGPDPRTLHLQAPTVPGSGL